MPKAIKSLLVTIALFAVVLGIGRVSWYAATHPWFATHILLPVIGVLMFLTMWAFCHMEMKRP